MLSNVGYIRGRGQQFLVAPSVFREPLTISRAQTGGVQSSALAADGSSLTFYAADTPRFTGSAQRLLTEGQRTNRVMQPIAVASATGAWGQFGGTATPSITRNYAIAPDGTQTAARVRWVGPGTVGATLRVPITGFPASTTGTVSFYIFVRSLGNATFISTDIMDGATIFLPAGSIPLNTWLRLTSTQTSGTGGQHIDFGMWDYTTGDVDFDLWGVQVEEASFASSLIIPPSATPGAATRGVDLNSATLANLGIAANGACTVLWSGLFSGFDGSIQSLLHIDDNSANNRMTFRVTSSQTFEVVRTTSGITASTTNAAMVVGQQYKIGITPNGSGLLSASINGAVPFNVAGCPTTGLLAFRFGNTVSQNTPAFTETARLRILPYSVPDATLQSLVSALP